MRIIVAGSRSLNPYAHGITALQAERLTTRIRAAIWSGLSALLPFDVFSTLCKVSPNYNTQYPVTDVAGVEFIVGTAAGPDTVGELYGREIGTAVTRMPADWSLGRGAGYKRNRAMADYAVAGPGGADDAGLIAVWDGVSKGTKHMIETARLVGMKDEHIYVATLSPLDVCNGR